MDFIDLIKALAKPAESKRYIYKVPRSGGGFKYIYPGSGDRDRARTGKKEATKKRGGKSAPKPPVSDELSAIPFDGQPFDAATFAALGKVVATSSDRRVVRDRFGGLWGLRDGHLVKL